MQPGYVLTKGWLSEHLLGNFGVWVLLGKPW